MTDCFILLSPKICFIITICYASIAIFLLHPASVHHNQLQHLHPKNNAIYGTGLRIFAFAVQAFWFSDEAGEAPFLKAFFKFT